MYVQLVKIPLGFEVGYHIAKRHTKKGYASGGTIWTAAVEIDPAGTNIYTINFTGNNTKTENYASWYRIKDNSTGHIITGVE